MNQNCISIISDFWGHVFGTGPVTPVDIWKLLPTRPRFYCECEFKCTAQIATKLDMPITFIRWALVYLYFGCGAFLDTLITGNSPGAESGQC